MANQDGRDGEEDMTEDKGARMREGHLHPAINPKRRPARIA